MDQIDRLVFDVTGRDRGGSKVLSDASAKADAAHQSMSKLGSTLSGLGGPFESVINYGQQLAGSFDSSIGKAQKLGLATAAVGAGLIAVSAKEQQAQRQLQQSIQNTGSSYADYRGQINAAVKAQEGNAHTADDTQNALVTLTTATQDAGRALSEMNVVADIAAQKHESLTEAAAQLSSAQLGNLRAFRSFGISLDTTLPKAQAIDKALRQLTDRVAGQAPAAVDTFAGHLRVMEARIHDNIAALGKYGPVVTAAGAALTIVASVLQLKASRQLADSAATIAETQAETANAAARLRTAEAAGVQAAAIQRATLAQSEGAAIGGAMAGNLGAGLATRAIGGRLLRAGGYALGGQVVGGLVGGQTGSVISGAGYGAALGSFAGPEGTVIGAVIGGGIGLARQTGYHGPDQQALNAAASTTAGYAKMQQQYRQFNDTAAHTTGLVHDAAVKMRDQTKAALDAGKAQHQYATSLIATADATKTLNVSMDGEITRLRATFDKAVGLQQAEDDLGAAMQTMAQTAHDGTRALRGHTAEADANRKALRDSASKILDVIQKMRDQHVGQDRVRASAIKMADALETSATKTYGSKAAVDKLLGSLGLLPGQIRNSLVSMKGLGTDLDNFFSGVAASAFSWGANAGAAFQEGISSNGTPTFDPNPNHNPGNTNPGNSPAVQKYAAQQAKNVTDSMKAANDAISKAARQEAAKQAADAAKAAAAAAAQQAAAAAKAARQAEVQYMHSVLSQVTSAYQATKQGLIQAASLANRPQGTDLLGASGPPQSILAAKRQFAHDMIRFAHLLRRLADAHYHQTIIDEVESLGTVDGIAAAMELLAGGGKERRAVNRAEDRIQRASARIAAQTTAGDYGPEIVKALQKLPSDFDRKFEHTLRRLHIITDTGYQDHKQGNRVRAS